uniref:MADF domain-containing protein n=1 Tax=Romanomermis culicivorax TaxID=13658 RepID=A0A915JQ21_ROMCU
MNENLAEELEHMILKNCGLSEVSIVVKYKMSPTFKRTGCGEKSKIVQKFPVKKINQLINEVRANPCLWRRDDKHYKNYLMRDDVWNNISVRLGGVDKEILKWKWANLRTTFGHRCKSSATSGSHNQETNVTWEYFESLLFLKTSADKRISENNSPPPAGTGYINLKTENFDPDFDQPLSATPALPSCCDDSPPPHAKGAIDVIESIPTTKAFVEAPTPTSPSMMNADDVHFGQAVAEALSPYTHSQKIRIKAKIMQTI